MCNVVQVCTYQSQTGGSLFMGHTVYLSLEIDQGRAFCVCKICYWSVVSVNRDVNLSGIQWRASNRQTRQHVYATVGNAAMRAV